MLWLFPAAALSGCLDAEFSLLARNYTLEEAELVVEIRNAGGQVVYKGTFLVAPGGHAVTLDELDLKEGDYEVLASTGGQTEKNSRHFSDSLGAVNIWIRDEGPEIVFAIH